MSVITKGRNTNGVKSSSSPTLTSELGRDKQNPNEDTFSLS